MIATNVSDDIDTLAFELLLESVANESGIV